MASLVLTTVGGALGGVIGGPIGGVLGQAGGALAGQALGLGGAGTTGTRVAVGPRLTSLAGIASTEGAPIARVYGRARVGGQMIWATRFQEHTNFALEPSHGGKGGGASTPAQVDVTYSYTANFAIGLCEGPIALVRRVWADGQELDLTTVTMRVYTGTQDQPPDPLIAAKEEPGTVPAYRGLAYVVFEAMPIGAFGNRIPQLAFEVVRPVDGIGAMIRAVNLIPGATEFGYQPSLHLSIPGPGTTVAENRNQSFAATDWGGSLDALQALCPNLVSVALVVVWFGDDLRASHCTVAPRVDNAFKTLSFPFVPQIVDDWSVAGVARAGARLVSFVDGGAAYGGTPSDASVVAAIQDLRARGLSVVLYPFVMMDVAAGNDLPDPWTGSPGQPPFPWRGRITCDPAPDVAGSPDGTAEAAAQVASFFGSPVPGADEWSYRRFVLHCVDLVQASGGVDAFLVGSELVSLTQVRAAPGVYPAAQALATLAADVKARLGAGTKVSYGADWTEYGAHVRDGGAEVRFPLDVVWASPSVDFVGIDVYWPLSDWRDGDHLDAQVAESIYDLAYLRGRIASGEAYDWFYPDATARAAQARVPITDGACGKPWVFRQKDIANWWSNAHLERVGSVEIGATGWVPGSKPIWFTETGCPAVDRGPNAPNLFPDPKSSESGLPPFSRAFRDDLIQHRFIEAVLSRFDPAQPGFEESDNPRAPSGVRMVDPARIHLWAWDARPFPAFPALSLLWSDAADWRTGHWLSGRLEGVPLDRLFAALTGGVLAASACPRPAVEGFVDGYVLDRPMATRDAIEPLTTLFTCDAVVSSGAVRFVSRARRPVAALTSDALLPAKDGSLLSVTRAQESDLPHEIAVTFGDADSDYAPASVLSRRIEGYSARLAQMESAVMTNRGAAQRAADTWLDDLWSGRETATFDLDPRLLAIEPGDIVTLDHAGVTRRLQIDAIADGATRRIAARAVDAAAFDRGAIDVAPPPQHPPAVVGPPHVLLIDLAVARSDPVGLQYMAALAKPWPGALHVFRSLAGETDAYVTTLVRQATIGVTLDALPPGFPARFDRGTQVRVELYAGALASVSDQQALGGANTFAVQVPGGRWEIICAAGAELVSPSTYRLSRIVRGLGDDEALATSAVPAGAPLILLDAAVVPVASGLASLGTTNAWRIGPASRDPGDASYVTVTADVTPRALLPRAPVRPTARRGDDGIALTWIRRGRIDADGWDALDIPLGEDGERYRVAIARPNASPRVLDATQQSALYAQADVLADFAAVPGSLDLTIVQMSAAVGAGFPLTATVPVT